MKTPTRRQIQEALAPALIKAIDGLNMPQNSTSLLRTIRALTELAFDIAASGGCPPAAMLVQLQRVSRRRLKELKAGRPVWMQSEGKA